MTDLLRNFSHDQNGATSLEYAFIGMSICVVIVAAVTEAGLTISTIMEQVAAGFAN